MNTPVTTTTFLSGTYQPPGCLITTEMETTGTFQERPGPRLQYVGDECQQGALVENVPSYTFQLVENVPSHTFHPVENVPSYTFQPVDRVTELQERLSTLQAEVSLLRTMVTGSDRANVSQEVTQSTFEKVDYISSYDYAMKAVK